MDIEQAMDDLFREMDKAGIDSLSQIEDSFECFEEKELYMLLVHLNDRRIKKRVEKVNGEWILHINYTQSENTIKISCNYYGYKIESILSKDAFSTNELTNVVRNHFVSYFDCSYPQYVGKGKDFAQLFLDIANHY